MDPCPHCGRDDFGNPGGRTQHVRACREKAEKFKDDTPDDDPQIVEAEPARGGGGPPAPQQDSGGVDTAGEQMATGLAAAFDDEAPVQERKTAVKKATSLVGGVLSGLMEHREQKEQRAKRRAKESSVEQVEDKPGCECGLTFARIPPNADRIQCPECGREYQVV